MPQLDPRVISPSEVYGKVQVDNTLTLGERIRKRFKPTDTVKVHNPTNVPIRWQWLEESEENYTIEDGSNVKIVERGDPGIWELEPGEQDILQGSCAYLMIEAMYKQIAVMKTGIVLHPLDEREIKNFGFDDPQKQEELIDIIFRGKVTPQMMAVAAAESMGGMESKVSLKLNPLADERSEYDRRLQEQGRSVIPAVPVLPAAQAPATELSDLAQESPFAGEEVTEEGPSDPVEGEVVSEPKPAAKAVKSAASKN